MNGAENYQRAGALLDLARAASREQPDWAREYVAAAKVHATLALAAAVLDTRTVDGRHADAWNAATASGPANTPTTTVDGAS